VSLSPAGRRTEIERCVLVATVLRTCMPIADSVSTVYVSGARVRVCVLVCVCDCARTHVYLSSASNIYKYTNI
jgi:hypothetical protein